MEFDKKPNVIKFEGSKLQTTQQLIDELRVTLGQPKYDKWSTNLDGNVTLAETLDELVDALNGLENYYKFYTEKWANKLAGLETYGHYHLLRFKEIQKITTSNTPGYTW